MKQRLARGYAVFVSLVLILVAEYFIGTRVHSWGWPYLLALALAGASLISYFYMHIRQMRSGSDDDGDD